MSKNTDLMDLFIKLCKEQGIEISERKEGEYPNIKGAVFLTPEGPKDFLGALEVSSKYSEYEPNKDIFKTGDKVLIEAEIISSSEDNGEIYYSIICGEYMMRVHESLIKGKC